MSIDFDICAIGVTFWRNPEMHPVEIGSHYIVDTVFSAPLTLQPWRAIQRRMELALPLRRYIIR